MITLIHPGTGVRHHYDGRWLRPSPATDEDIKRGRARFRGDQVWLSLPPGVQIQLDSGHLQIDTDYAARTALEDSQNLGAAMPKGNASHEAWANYAVTQGMPREEASGLSRDAIKARFAAPVFDPAAPPDLPDGIEMLNETP